MRLQAVLVPDQHDERRSAERQAINRPSTLRDERLTACDVYVRDLSETGFNVATDATLTLGSIVSIGLPGHGRASARVIRPVPGGYGCEFFAPIDSGALANVFRGGTVVSMTTAEPMLLPSPEPVVERWPGAVRAAVIVGSSMLLWSAIAYAAGKLI